MKKAVVFHKHVIIYLEGTATRKVGNFFARSVGYGHASQVERAIAKIAKKYFKLDSLPLADRLFEMIGLDARCSIEGVKVIIEESGDKNSVEAFLSEVRQLKFS